MEWKGRVAGWMWAGGERQALSTSVWAQGEGSIFAELRLEGEVRVLAGSYVWFWTGCFGKACEVPRVELSGEQLSERA